MIAQRVGVAAMRRGATANLLQTAPRMALAACPSMQKHISTAKVTPKEGHEILAAQRLNRPISPHLGIYKIEQTWFGASAWTRITGITLSGTAYLYFATYLAAPLLGWHVESAALASGFAALPLAAKGGLKFALAFPFTFHFINGVKHLVYDLGIGFQKTQIKKGEMALWVSSVLGALGLAFGL
ncbi:Succinate dehydrogenase cytochrome B subunit [Escovopsis weberi]|uniref:Succinate dehydrogenase cytochrome B subunit n=1 Tax=Escovopsis weberi TaxID=150374 RepID=A0A0M8MZR5_ESCWE|nr:Succinate dehydrogenase cytochrome B subunit [Escovopsis weberi]